MDMDKKYELECRTPIKMSSAELKKAGGYWIYLQTKFDESDPNGYDFGGVYWGGWRWIPA